MAKMRYRAAIFLAAMASSAAAVRAAQAVGWQHPGGIVTEQTIAQVKAKVGAYEWARTVYNDRKAALDRWAKVPSAELKRVFPTRPGNVYHNFSCPTDRHRLAFDPFQCEAFMCPSCGKTYPPDTDAGIYSPGDRYNGTMYDGWACLFYEEAGAVAGDMGLVGRIEGRQDYLQRGVEILLLYADTIEGLKTDFQKDRQFSRILTYHREGDNKVLNDLARAYELLRAHMSPQQRDRFERVALQRMLNDVMLEPIYTYNHNNLYQWHRTIVQTAIALERDDLIDWSFGHGKWDPQHEPEHRSIRRLAATHFKPDGAFWEMCSGYHLYPLHTFCELAVISHNLVGMDPQRFPAERYDLTSRSSPAGEVIYNALQWFMSMAMPDRTMPTIGDSPASRAGMTDYYSTAEIGYRFFDLKAVGDYGSLRQGKRHWEALFYGPPEIKQVPLPFTSSYLSSGWVSLRNEWQGSRVWVGLNALIPGGGHQHADRLTLLSYSHGQLLALEKATPYNEAVTRVLGTLSPSHNTVTMDQTSQKQGEALHGEEVPRVAYFFAGPIAKFAELHADRLYNQMKTYRRSVAVIEDLWVDLFRASGGSTHDWIVHHAGTGPKFSMPMQAGTFGPKEWLANGTNRVLAAGTDDAWDARWQVADVTSRLTMMAGAATEVFALETYPVDNAVVTPKDPPCQSLVVRRHGDAPFLAVWDAWRGSPNLQSVTAGRGEPSVRLKTLSNTYYLLFGPGEARFEDGASVRSDAAFAACRNRDAAMFVGGTTLEVACPQGRLRLVADQPATVSVEWSQNVATIEIAGDIHYDTVGGCDRYRPGPPVNVAIEGDLWQITKRQHRFAGQIK